MHPCIMRALDRYSLDLASRSLRNVQGIGSSPLPSHQCLYDLYMALSCCTDGRRQQMMKMCQEAIKVKPCVIVVSTTNHAPASRQMVQCHQCIMTFFFRSILSWPLIMFLHSVSQSRPRSAGSALSIRRHSSFQAPPIHAITLTNS